ncbi:hypothetical protein M8818_003708 [Zalaria obscura]|uniref:Uncharacterized protein n=1 Tax=Zalaria obscura TaxID=2024903 RepID=A0ACC3SF13_9PEZI
MVDWTTAQDWLAWSFSPSISAILLTLFLSLALPLSIHAYLYRQRASSVTPSFLLLGPTGAGKTSLQTLFERGNATPTHTSQSPATVTCALPRDVTAASSKYRSTNDPSAKTERKLHLIDTPGHGKLRHHAFSALTAPALSGLIFVVDSAALSSANGLTEAATYLHDLLLALQKRHTSAKTSKGPKTLNVLVAANKQDLFTALPAQLVRKNLEREITKVRDTRAKGLLDSGVGGDEDEEEREWLGEGGEGAFEFRQMEECGVEVQVVGGNVRAEGDEAPHVQNWWAWVAENM